MTAASPDAMTLAYHEMRSPLGLLITTARLVADECPDGDLRSRCEIIVRAAERLMRNAMSVLELGGTDEVTTKATALSVSGLVADVVNGYAFLGEDIELKDRAFGKLTDSRAGLEALVCSLIGNALDHREPGSTVRVTLAGRPGFASITISNRVAAVRQHNGSRFGSGIARGLAHAAGACLHVRPGRVYFVARVRVADSRGPVASG